MKITIRCFDYFVNVSVFDGDGDVLATEEETTELITPLIEYYVLKNLSQFIWDWYSKAIKIMKKNKEDKNLIQFTKDEYKVLGKKIIKEMKKSVIPKEIRKRVDELEVWKHRGYEMTAEEIFDHLQTTKFANMEKKKNIENLFD